MNHPITAAVPVNPVLWLAAWRFSFWYWNWGVPVKKPPCISPKVFYELIVNHRVVSVFCKMWESICPQWESIIWVFICRIAAYNLNKVPLFLTFLHCAFFKCFFKPQWESIIWVFICRIAAYHLKPFEQSASLWKQSCQLLQNPELNLHLIARSRFSSHADKSS